MGLNSFGIPRSLLTKVMKQVFLNILFQCMSEWVSVKVCACDRLLYSDYKSSQMELELRLSTEQQKVGSTN